MDVLLLVLFALEIANLKIAYNNVWNNKDSAKLVAVLLLNSQNHNFEIFIIHLLLNEYSNFFYNFF